jgi:hypothetical protein
MTTILTFRKDGRHPFCELVLASGERVLVSLDAAGVAIERLSGREVAYELLFRGSADVAAWLCATLQQGRRGALADPLDVIVRLVAALGSADRVKQAFCDAAESRSHH